ncbi:MAG: hypothetical protein U0228_37240 [Myxococcaceae bacterium]
MAGVEPSSSDALKRTLDAEPNAALMLDERGRITWVNAEWNRRALADGARNLLGPRIIGTDYLWWLKGTLQSQAAAILSNLPAEPSPDALTLEGECNTPLVHQRLSTHFARLAQPRRGVLVRFFLRVEGPLAQRHQLSERPRESFVDENGIITQCGCCRRSRDPRTGQWHLSLALFPGGQSDVSHGLCDSCTEAYYPA